MAAVDHVPPTEAASDHDGGNTDPVELAILASSTSEAPFTATEYAAEPTPDSAPVTDDAPTVRSDVPAVGASSFLAATFVVVAAVIVDPNVQQVPVVRARELVTQHLPRTKQSARKSIQPDKKTPHV